MTDRPCYPRVARTGGVVVVEDHPLVAAAVRDLILRYSPSVTVRLCPSIMAALSVLHFHEPNLVILDLGLPDASGIEGIVAVRSVTPRAYLAIFSGNDALAHTIPEVRSGTIPFLRKGAPERELCSAVHKLLRCSGLVDGLGQSLAEPGSAHNRFELLSPKQRQILGLLSTGRSNGDIAETLHVSAETIKTHLHVIFTKLEVKNRTQAVALYQTAFPMLDNDERKYTLRTHSPH